MTDSCTNPKNLLPFVDSSCHFINSDTLAYAARSNRDTLIRRLKQELDAKQPVRDEALLVDGLLDAVFARYHASDRQLKKYEQRYLELARGLVQTIYEEIRTKARRRLPDRLWDGDQGLLNARLVTRYVIERKAGWKLDNTLPKKTTAIWFIRASLGSMLKRLGVSPLRVMLAAYPEHFFDPKHPTKPHLWHPWDFAPQGMWQGRAGDEWAREAIRHVVEVHEGWKLDETLPRKASEDWFCEVALSGMLQTKFRDSPLLALQAAYPEHFFDPKYPTKPYVWHPWDFRHKGMWQGKAGDELAKQAIRHLTEVHEGWKLDETLPEKATHAWFKQVGLAGMLVSNKKVNSSLQAAVRIAYPEHFFDPVQPMRRHLWHDWDFKNNRTIWRGKAGEASAKQAIRHLIEVHEGWPVDERLPWKAIDPWFRTAGLGGMLAAKFRGSRRAAVRFAYPEHFFDSMQPTKRHLWHPWDFRHNRMWWGKAGDELASQAIRHVVEVHEGWKVDETLPKKATQAWFTKVGLQGMLSNKFRGSPHAALRLAYPEHLFDPMHPTKHHVWHEWEFHHRPGMWQGKAGAALARQAIHRVIKVHEGWPVDRTLPMRVTKAWFHGIGLIGMLDQRFQSSPRAALGFVYPYLFGPNGRWPLGVMRPNLKPEQRSP